jgi:peroxiredoxin
MKKISVAIFCLLFLLGASMQGIELKKGMKFNYNISSFDESTEYFYDTETGVQDERFIKEKLQLEVMACYKDYYLLKVVKTNNEWYRRFKSDDNNQWLSNEYRSRELLPDTAKDAISEYYEGGTVPEYNLLVKFSLEGKILSIEDIARHSNVPYEYCEKFLSGYIFSMSSKLAVGDQFKQDTISYKVLEKTSDYWLLAKMPVEGQKIQSTVKVDATTCMLIESYNSEYIKKEFETYSYSGLDYKRGEKFKEKLEQGKILHANIVKTNTTPFKCRYRINENEKDTIFNETNVTIRGTIKNAPVKSDIALYWYEPSLLNKVRNQISTDINNKKQFELRLKINDIRKVSLKCQDKEVEFFVLPGADVTLEFDYNNFLASLNCKGIGSNSINFIFENLRFDEKEQFNSRKIGENALKLQHSLNSQAFEKYVQDAFSKKIDFLNDWRAKIAPEVYFSEYWKNQINLVKILTNYMGNQRFQKKIAPSGDTTYISHDPVNVNKLIDVQKYIHPNNAMMTYYDSFGSFLYTYTFQNLQEKITKFTGVTNKPNDNYELISRYDFCNTFYSGKNSFLLKYHVVADAFVRGDWEACKQLYSRFTCEYPYSTYTKYVKEEYKRIQRISPGQTVNDFDLKDLDGKKVNLSEFNGKAVYLVFFDISKDFSRLNSLLEKYGNKMYDRCQKKNVEFVYVSMNDNLEETKAYFEKTGFKGIKLITKDKKAIKDMFYFSSSNYTLILDVDGKIVYKPTPDFTEIYDDPNFLFKATKPLFRNKSSQTVFILKIISGSLLFLVLISVFIIFINKKRAARKVKLANLNTKVRQLELTAIRAQMNPHFLYNCLNSIQNLVQKNQTEQAHLYLSKFAGLIRLTLKKSDKEEATLAEELELITQYVELEQLRFDIDFKINIEKGIDPFSVYIPPLLLQPLVENSIVHGLSQKTGNRKLLVDVKRGNGQIFISVEDNGIGREASGSISKVSTGKGIGFTKERLDLITEKYGTQYQFNIYDLNKSTETVEEKGTKVEICFVEE